MTWTCYQVNSGLTFNSTKSQWVDLWINTDVCMTRPETCGAAGGAISLWLQLIDCTGIDGIISSLTDGFTGSLIYCSSSTIRYDTHVLTNILS